MVFDIKKFNDSDYKLNPSSSSEFSGYICMPKSLYMCPTMTIPMEINGIRNAYLFSKTLIQTLTEKNYTKACSCSIVRNWCWTNETENNN